MKIFKFTVYLAVALLIALGVGGLGSEQAKGEELIKYGTAVPPYLYEEKEVSFVNKKANVILAGTLTLPDRDPPYPSAVLISGGGAHDRDYTIFGGKPFLVVSDFLTRRGIAVLRYDDRGTGESTGDRSISTTKDYAGDALAAVQFLKSRSDIDPDRIGLIGHSEGGTIASLAAVESSGVAFVIMMATPGLAGIDYNLQYEESIGRMSGLSEKDLAERRAFQERIFAVVLGEKDKDIARRKLEEIYRKNYPDLSKERINWGIKRLLSPWFVYNLRYDPAVTLESIRCPVLAVFGEKDVQVPPEGNAKAIKEALGRSGSYNHVVEVIPDLNHFMQTSETGWPEEYGKIDETISSAVLELIGDWIKLQLGD
jgi:hypothetical protein